MPLEFGRRWRALDFDHGPGQTDRMAEETNSRLEKLESVVAHLEHQLEQVNAVVIAQGKVLERLKKEVQRQSSALEEQELDRIKANPARPPHYQ